MQATLRDNVQPMTPTERLRVRRTIALDAVCRTIVLLYMLWYVWTVRATNDAVFIDVRPVAWVVAGWQAVALLVEGVALRWPSVDRAARRDET